MVFASRGAFDRSADSVWTQSVRLTSAYCVFLGRIAPVGRLNGEYIVADLEDVVNVSLDVSTPASQFRIDQHVTKGIRTE